MKPYRAIVIGGTGAVGASLVRELLECSNCERVTLIVRRELPDDFFNDEDRKIRLSVLDMNQLGHEVVPLARDCQVAFSTMGIGQPRKVSKEHFWKVDVEYASAFARACKIAGADHFSLLSSVGADPNSKMNYLHVKGVAEERILQLGFNRVSFFRPSLLVTKRIRYGLQDRLTQALFPIFSRFLAPQYHEVAVEDVGRAMRINVERDGQGAEVLRYPEMFALLNQPRQAKARAGM